MVGDPKQAIYRFRGADVGSYSEARDAIARRWPDNIVQITANFRSRPAILTHINHCFATPRLGPEGQPGYVALAATLDPPDHDLPCAAKITIDLPPDARPAQIRDAEAEAVADLCARLIGNVTIRDDRRRTCAAHAGRHRASRADGHGALALRTRASKPVAFRSLPRPGKDCSAARKCRTSSRSRACSPTAATPSRSAP